MEALDRAYTKNVHRFMQPEYAKQLFQNQMSVSATPNRMEPSDTPPAPSPDMNIVSTVRIYPNRKIRSLSTMISKPKAGAPFTLKIFWISKRTGKTATSKNESAKERNERAGTKRMGGALQTV